MLNLASGLIVRGERVDVVAASAAGVLREQVPSPARVIDLQAARVLFSLPALVRYLRRERPRALISAMDHTNVIALWARWLARVDARVIATVHCLASTEAQAARRIRSKLSPWFVRRFYPWADSIVAVSRPPADELAGTCGVPRQRIRVIPNAVLTPAMFMQAKEPVAHAVFASGDPVILGVGRLVAQKRFETLIRAFAQVRRKVAAHLIILGDGPERPRLRALAAELGIDHAVELLGYTPNPYAWMARAALLVLPSDFEALPTVLIEALGLGARVVASDTPGSREVLAGGRYGRLASVGDAEALATAITASLAEPPPVGLAEALRQYTLESVTTAYVDVLEEVRAAGAAAS